MPFKFFKKAAPASVPEPATMKLCAYCGAPGRGDNCEYCGMPLTEAGVRALEPGEDPLLPEAMELALSAGIVSVPALQRSLKIGYSRAARLVDRLRALGYLGPPSLVNGELASLPRISRKEWEYLQRGRAPGK